MGPIGVPESIPGLLSTGRGNSIRAERRRPMTIFVITISALIKTIRVSVTLRLRRK
jgi:hypothetical protein